MGSLITLPVRGVFLASCLVAAALSGCSRSEPTSSDFTLVSQSPKKADKTEDALEAAEAACKAETKQSGIRSMVAIVSRLRPGKVDEDYIACMKARGYEPGN